jgi:hypothetical protein
MPTVWHAEEQLYEKSSNNDRPIIHLSKKMGYKWRPIIRNHDINLPKIKNTNVNNDFIGRCLPIHAKCSNKKN